MISERDKKRAFKKYGITCPDPGDVLAIPLDGERVYIAQVIAYDYLAFYMVVFERQVPPDPTDQQIDEALASPPLLAGLTMDGRIRPGVPDMWSIVGQRPVDPDRYLPAYRARSQGVWYIQNLDRSIVRLARPGEEERFKNHKVSSPMVFQDTLRALNGLDHELADWKQVYSNLDATKVILAKDVLP